MPTVAGVFPLQPSLAHRALFLLSTCVPSRLSGPSPLLPRASSTQLRVRPLQPLSLPNPLPLLLTNLGADITLQKLVLSGSLTLLADGALGLAAGLSIFVVTRLSDAQETKWALQPNPPT